MPNTPVYTTGVKYIKIAKQDSGSVDNSIELQNLTDIRIKFSDINNAVQYNVASITEYSTYYLYNIVPLNITSSADQEILDYKVSASDGGILGNGGLLFSSIYADPLGYFDDIYLNMPNTPNVVLNISFSLSQSDVNPTTASLYQFNTSSLPTPLIIGDPIITFSFPPNPSSGYITRTGSFTPIEGCSYGFKIDNNSNYYNSYFVLTQSFAPEASNYDIVVLEPYAEYNFYNSDCNVIQNNVDANNISTLYMDVDFNGGQIVAQNQSAILNGTALRAQVQPWNYSYYSQISGRYIGKQQNAIALNTYTGPTTYTNGTSSAYGYTGSWPGDSISPGAIVPGDIVIQWLDSCIYEMNYGGPGYPENINGGGISMGNIYLVGDTRDDVAIIKPGTDIYYDILEKTFPSGSPAFQYQYTNSPTLPNQLNITYPSLLLPSATYYLASNYIQPVLPQTSSIVYITGSVSGSILPTLGAGTGSVIKASWADLNYNPIYSASIAASQIYKLTVVTASTYLPGVEVSVVNNFTADAVNGLSYNYQITQFTTYDSTTDSISFFYTGASNLGPWREANGSNTATVNYNLATFWGTLYPTGSPSFMNGTPYIFIGDDQATYIPSSGISINGDLYQKSSSPIQNTGFLNSLNDGNRWFMSFYSGSGPITNLTGGLPPTCSTTLEQIGFPFEIDQYISPGIGDNYITFKNPSAIKYWFETGSTYSSSAIGIGGYSGKSYTGILVTKAQYPTNGLTIVGLPNSNFAGAGKGYILSQYPKRVITQNIDYILKTYGNQPT